MTNFAISNPNMMDAVALGSSVYDPKLFQLGEYYKKTGKTKAKAGLDIAGLNVAKKAKEVDFGIAGIESAARAEANAINQNGFTNFATGIGSGLLGGFGKMGGGGGAGGGMSFADGMNSGLPSFGDYSGIPSGGFGIPFG